MTWQQKAENLLSLYQRWRGTVLNRAGFLLVVAGIGELTSIIQNLLAILFVIAKVPVPFSDPPPWVGISLIAMGLVALAANRILPDRAREVSQRPEPHPQDVQLLRNFRALFTDAAMEFLTNHDFAAVFSWEQIRPIQKFAIEWVGPRFEFDDPATEAEFIKVKAAAASLNDMIKHYAYVHDTNIDVATTRPGNYYTDDEIERLTDERVARMNKLATALVEGIHNFERAAKNRIQAI